MASNRILTAVMAGGIAIGAASTGYVIGQFTSVSGHYASQYQPVAHGDTGQFIAQKAGTGLAGKAPRNVPLSRVKTLSEQEPAGASIDTRTDTIIFHTATASFTVVAIAPGKPDMTFTIARLTNPAIIIPRGAQVTVRFINNDTDEAHGWLITGSEPPFGFGQRPGTSCGAAETVRGGAGPHGSGGICGVSSLADAVQDRGEESGLDLAPQRAAALDLIFGSADPVAAVRLLFAAGAVRAVA